MFVRGGKVFVSDPPLLLCNLVASVCLIHFCTDQYDTLQQRGFDCAKAEQVLVALAS